VIYLAFDRVATRFRGRNPGEDRGALADNPT
jgi:hypothetical protein